MSGLEHKVVDVGGGDPVVFVMFFARIDGHRDLGWFERSRLAFEGTVQILGQMRQTSSNEAF
jgi:hypothetical protein